MPTNSHREILHVVKQSRHVEEWQEAETENRKINENFERVTGNVEKLKSDVPRRNQERVGSLPPWRVDRLHEKAKKDTDREVNSQG